MTLPLTLSVSNLPAPLVDLIAAQDGAPAGIGLCAWFGEFRNGIKAVTVGAFLRVGVSPDASTVVFELNHAFSA